MRRADVVTALAALCLLAHCGGDGVPPQSASPGSAPRTAPRGRPGASSASEPGIDLQAMLAPVPEYAGQGRNLFEFGRERVAPPPRATSTAAPTTRPTTRPPTNPTPRVPTARAQRVDVKYAGFVEKTTAEGEKQKYAIFLDGNDILAGAEGDTVANRFTIVQIGLESVTVSAEGSSATQRIPLQSN